MRASKSLPRAPRGSPPYRVFLLRCRLEEGASPGAGQGCEPAGEPVWRFTVQQVGPNAARCSFTSLRDVTDHVQAELASCGSFPPRNQTNYDCQKES